MEGTAGSTIAKATCHQLAAPRSSDLFGIGQYAALNHYPLPDYRPFLRQGRWPGSTLLTAGFVRRALVRISAESRPATVQLTVCTNWLRVY